MSTPFGLDLGNNNSVLAVARNRGIDIVVNEVSNRSTPSVVGFGPKNRYLGETDFEQESKYFTSKLVELDDKKTGAEVRFAGEKHVFSATQLAAMFIDKVKDTVKQDTKANITDVCIAVPPWYTEEQRYNIADAARIAGLNPVRIVNDVTAAGVSYGIFKTDLPEGEEKPRIVAFVDIGHSSYTCSIMAFKKGQLKVLGTACDKHFGAQAKLSAEEVDFVEIIGGTTRIPTLKQSISEAFGKPLSTTLNQDEAIAKGAAFICAFTPTLRVRPFKFEDIHPYSVSYSWDKQVEDEDHMELPPNTPEQIANWEITGVQLPEGQDSVPVKLKLRCDPSGLHTIEEAYTIEDIEVEEPIPLPEDAPEDAEQEFKKVTKTVKKDDLTIVAIHLCPRR
ncbi:adenyl-nucleotide exchange factor sse1 [Fusarium oxysporum]|nr:adenyl-nucleotide exchange factor sse1 [Fusarium oxysporum]